LIAALGAIEKNDATFRVIHNATHKVKVNRQKSTKISLGIQQQKNSKSSTEKLRATELLGA